MSDKPRLLIGLPCYRDMPCQFVERLFDLIWPEEPLNFQYCIRLLPGNSLIPWARNEITADFLAGPYSHLLFVDTDIEFEPFHIERLLSHDQPIVRGFYAMKDSTKPAWCCRRLPNFPPPDERGLMPLRAIGTGFLLVKREVFERIRDAKPEIAYTAKLPGQETVRTEWDFWPVGVHTEPPDGPVIYESEDWGFCRVAREAGFTVYGDTQVRLRHVGSVSYPVFELPTDYTGVPNIFNELLFALRAFNGPLAVRAEKHEKARLK